MIQKIKVLVEYKKSKQFGFNPHVWVGITSDSGYEEYRGTASGAGYDKQSVALASALNQSAEVIQLLQSISSKFDVINDSFKFIGGMGTDDIVRVFEASGMTAEFISFNFEKTHSKAIFIYRPVMFCGVN
jgi:hypothetical protein